MQVTESDLRQGATRRRVPHQGEPGDEANPEAPSSAQVACRTDRWGTDESELPTPQEGVPASGISPSVRDTKRTGTL